jgi:hypothetical protein
LNATVPVSTAWYVSQRREKLPLAANGMCRQD